MAEWLSPLDPHSFARPEECCVVDLNLDLHVDFSSKVVHGTAVYKCKRNDGTAILVLDTDGISVSRVYCNQTSQDLTFTLSEPVGRFGSKLEITLLQSFDQEFEICIDFKNSPSATGLQWLTAEQTVGKRHPYMFSQFQPTFARTMLPCQDTPGVKHPYRAKKVEFFSVSFHSRKHSYLLVLTEYMPLPPQLIYKTYFRS